MIWVGVISQLGRAIVRVWFAIHGGFRGNWDLLWLVSTVDSFVKLPCFVHAEDRG
uniref:Uncharacterized protein n=1 Tax=Arundo donax TaxID=35708 RepID=A0A0A9A3E1_ARUDO